MTRLDPETDPIEGAAVGELVEQFPHRQHTHETDSDGAYDEKKGASEGSESVAEVEIEVESGKPVHEKVLETAEDFSRALVSLDDDPTLPIHTFRMWFTGIGLAVFGAVLGMLFQFRPQVILVSALFLQLIAFMIGRFLAAAIPGPGSRLHTGSAFWNFMNPGPFNIKEHVAAQIMANTAATAAQACLVFAADDLFYNKLVNPGNAIFTLLASQLIGYGFAGMFRAFLVYPTIMLYPQNLIYVNLFDVLHRSKGEMLQGKRLRFFWIVTAYIAPLLGSINIVCLCARNSDWVSYIFGGAEGNEGMGLLGFGVDWANITSAPFYLPLSTQISNYVGWMLNYIILPAVFASNVWHAQNFPFISEVRFHENGTIYNQNLILNADGSLNRTALDTFGQPWISSSQVIYYFGINLSIGATVVHIALWHGKEMWATFMDYIRGKPVNDIHYKHMGVMVCCYTEKSGLPWWALIVGLIFAILILPFYGAMYAITAWQPYIQYFMQIFGSALVPGSSQANMYFELYSSQPLVQAASMLSDLKLGQYTKNVIMQSVVRNERSILLSNEGTRVWNGQQVQSYNANAVLWGALGKEIFSPSGPYFIVPMGLVIGLALPVIPWLLYKRFNWAWLKLVNMAVLSYYIGDLAGGTNGYIMTWMAIGLTSHFYIRKYRAGWFRKYNYLFGAAVDGGAQLFVFIFSFTVGGAGGLTVDFPTWALNPVGNADYCKVTDSE
ncbi:OPT oligopeptide transporter [Wolfiporia cocos MD-104 SS10]|uniref:OPT oligopeptide transporter n=1 Tax=Wolfiporia cocos (strain MD-104) TaxID=742152 RepID=A0A2H3JM52_WOLCO|nr:OPT oligopeptide transporter [Wolfiporia cocos MD-104 SS10]